MRLNHFYCENNKGSVFFFFFFLAISSYSSFGSQVNLYDGQLIIYTVPCSHNETNICKCQTMLEPRVILWKVKSALALTRDFAFLTYASSGPFQDILNKIKHILCGP